MTYVYNSQLDAFTIYHVSREDSKPSSIIGPALPALGHALSGSAGTAISKLLTYPLDLVITRLQVQKQFQTDDKNADYKSITDAVQKIYDNEGGIKAFYSGVIPETLKGVADSFLFFLAYTYIRQKRLTAQSSKHLSVLDEIGVGVLAGAFSKFFTTPIQNIVTRKQTAALISARDPTSSLSPQLSARDVALQIKDEKGIQGFWSGYSASLILTLNPSITFLLHRVLLRLVVPKSRRLDPGASLTFLLAALSKAMASSVTYPFSLAKTRAQVSSQKPSEPTGPTSTSGDEKLASALDPLTESKPRAKVLRAERRTVFSTIIQIAQKEGLWALYQGLGAEVLKGFFSHGITMLIKDRIHSSIISLYYLVLQALKKYPSPEELANMASDQAKEAYEQSKGQMGQAYTNTVQAAGSASETVQSAVASGREQASELLEKGRDAASNASESLQSAVTNGKDRAGDLLEKGKDAASSASEQAKDYLNNKK